MQTDTFLGQECLVLENELLRLRITRAVGPRILSFGFREGENLFAELPGVTIHLPGSQPFHFYGGHRLWHAPEDPARTYLPDDSPVDIVPSGQGLTVVQETEARTGLQKSLVIRLVAGSAQAVVEHHLTNHSAWPVTCAPWALTQLKTGGVAILPQATHDTGVLPNRSLALWPYTDMAAPQVRWGSRYILVQARVQTPFKVGFPNPRGWLAYAWNGLLFVKQAGYDPQAEYFDSGSSSECYLDHRFVELETLGPRRTLAPGETASHIETWNLYRDIEPPGDEDEAQALADRLGLE